MLLLMVGVVVVVVVVVGAVSLATGAGQLGGWEGGGCEGAAENEDVGKDGVVGAVMPPVDGGGIIVSSAELGNVAAAGAAALVGGGITALSDAAADDDDDAAAGWGDCVVWGAGIWTVVGSNPIDGIPVTPEGGGI